jgi:hypothetical protein
MVRVEDEMSRVWTRMTIASTILSHSVHDWLLYGTTRDMLRQDVDRHWASRHKVTRKVSSVQRSVSLLISTQRRSGGKDCRVMSSSLAHAYSWLLEYLADQSVRHSIVLKVRASFKVKYHERLGRKEEAFLRNTHCANLVASIAV